MPQVSLYCVSRNLTFHLATIGVASGESNGQKEPPLIHPLVADAPLPPNNDEKVDAYTCLGVKVTT